MDEPGTRSPGWVVGLLAGLAAIAVIVAALYAWRDDLTPATPALALTLPGVLAGVLANRRVAVVVALTAALAFNFFFLTPYGTLKVAVADDAIALAVFAVVASAVGIIAAREADGRRAAERRASELEALNREVQRVQGEREQLAAEVGRLEVLEEVDSQRAAMLRSVSHDLRTPLATIRAVSTDLRDGTNYDDRTRQELLELVTDEAERLDRLVSNLLNLSRIEAGGFVPDKQAVAMDELVAHTVRRLARLVRNVRVEVSVPEGLPLVDADYTQLDQVVSNLIENAVRHAPQGSTVRVSARPAGEMVEVSVSDEGAGVQRFERERIFEPFQRGDADKGTGSGIGLAICKAIVTAHGGTIDVIPAPGVGARFVFTVPVHHG